MSLSEEKSIEVNYRRDSFSDRVCDDLCEIILQYLPPKDKLKLECVSKQFQRTAFLSRCSQYFVISRKLAKKQEILKNLFKKFNPNISKIILDFECQRFLDHFSNDLIELIIKYCNNLTHILIINNKPIKTEVYKKLFDKFGHNLISINIFVQ